MRPQEQLGRVCVPRRSQKSLPTRGGEKTQKKNTMKEACFLFVFPFSVWVSSSCIPAGSSIAEGGSLSRSASKHAALAEDAVMAVTY